MTDFAAACAALADAPFQSTRLIDAFDPVAAAMAAERFYMVRLRENARLDFIVPDRMQSMLDTFLGQGWEPFDIWTQACFANYQPNMLMTDDRLIDRDARESSPFFQDFAQTWRCGRIAAWAFDWGGERWGFTLSRGERDGAYSEAERADINRLIGAANSAALVAAALGEARHHGFAEGMAHSGRPCLLIDHRGEVSFVSAAAERLFDAQFNIRDGKLVSASGPVQAALDRIAAMARSRGPWPDRPMTFSAPRSAPLKPVVIAANPLRRSALDLMPGAQVLLALAAPEVRAAPSRAALRAAFGLTQREADIAQRLAMGERVDGIAHRAGIKVATVRHFIKALRTKTGARRQGELVALLSAAAPAVGDDPT